MLCCTIHLRGQIDTIYTRSQPQLLWNKALQIAEMIDFGKSHLIYCLLGLCGKNQGQQTVSPRLIQGSPLSANSNPPVLPSSCLFTPLTSGDRWDTPCQRTWPPYLILPPQHNHYIPEQMSQPLIQSPLLFSCSPLFSLSFISEPLFNQPALWRWKHLCRETMGYQTITSYAL